MKFTVKSWTIQDLYDTYKAGKLNLSPPYQRNFIWSINDQRYLIEAIRKHNPIPNFFLLQNDGKFEMVDGQQRSRTILTFIDQQFTDFDGKNYSAELYPNYLKYDFPVTIITDTEGESIEKFYAMVNKSGVHLNKTEVRKADFYNTVLLNLVNEITDSKKFKLLKVFSEGSLKRMNDTEFVSELIILVLMGHVDKKNHLDEYYKNDISKEEAAEVKIKFNYVLDKINYLNSSFELVKSRYKQRNDFYTLFDFVLNNPVINQEDLLTLDKVLILIGPDIKPSQNNCIPLKEYAINCVTQSNSKNARENRVEFFNQLLLNKTQKTNQTQKQIMAFYGLANDATMKVADNLTIDFNALNGSKNIPFK